MIIDATNLILGRMAATAAKEALKGQTVTVVNCEKAIVTGNKSRVLETYAEKFEVGQVNQGPYFPTRPDMLVRRTIRGMLPRKKARGVKAYGRVTCHVGIPAEVKVTEAAALPQASLERIKKAPHITLSELCKHIGYKQGQ